MMKDQLKSEDPEEVRRLDRIYEDQAEFLLRIYGPEGAYALADKLKECADKDMSEAMDETNTKGDI